MREGSRLTELMPLRCSRSRRPFVSHCITLEVCEKINKNLPARETSVKEEAAGTADIPQMTHKPPPLHFPLPYAVRLPRELVLRDLW